MVGLHAKGGGRLENAVFAADACKLVHKDGPRLRGGGLAQRVADQPLGQGFPGIVVRLRVDGGLQLGILRPPRALVRQAFVRLVQQDAQVVAVGVDVRVARLGQVAVGGLEVFGGGVVVDLRLKDG